MHVRGRLQPALAVCWGQGTPRRQPRSRHGDDPPPRPGAAAAAPNNRCCRCCRCRCCRCCRCCGPHFLPQRSSATLAGSCSSRNTNATCNRNAQGTEGGMQGGEGALPGGGVCATAGRGGLARAAAGTPTQPAVSKVEERRGGALRELKKMRSVGVSMGAERAHAHAHRKGAGERGKPAGSSHPPGSTWRPAAGPAASWRCRPTRPCRPG